MPNTALEHVGHLYIENQRLLGEYQKLLGLVEQIRVGDVKPEQVTVDLKEVSWSVAMTGAEFAEVINSEAAQ